MARPSGRRPAASGSRPSDPSTATSPTCSWPTWRRWASTRRASSRCGGSSSTPTRRPAGRCAAWASRPGRSWGRRARRVQPARVAAQPGVRRRAGLAAALPLRRPSASARRRHRRGPRATLLVLDHGRLGRQRRLPAVSARAQRALRHRPLPAGPVEAGDRAGVRCEGELVRRTPSGRSSGALAAGLLPATPTDDLVLCVDEIAVNSLLHGGGGGVLRVWQQGRCAGVRGQRRREPSTDPWSAA